MEDNIKLYGYHFRNKKNIESSEYDKVDEKIGKIITDIDEILRQLMENPRKFPKSFRKTHFQDELVETANIEFISNLLLNVPLEDVEKYVKNTVMYEQGNEDADHQYVMCYRRAIPETEEMYDNFWTTSFSDAFYGLRKEQPFGSPQRLHSVIKVTTLAALEEHGLVETNSVGATDGEISIDPNKKFNGILFQYKDGVELEELKEYLKNGGITRKELIDSLSKTYESRTSKQYGLDEQLFALTEETSLTGYNGAIRTMKNEMEKDLLGIENQSDETLEGWNYSDGWE